MLSLPAYLKLQDLDVVTAPQAPRPQPTLLSILKASLKPTLSKLLGPLPIIVIPGGIKVLRTCTAPKSAKSLADVSLKAAPPIPHPSDERILVRFDGEMPPLLLKEYHEILGGLNTHLASLRLPELVYTQKHPESNGIFIVPRAKGDVAVLTEHWNAWAPQVLPGGRIAPVATYSYLQVNGIPFGAVDSLESTARSFESENKELGKVLSISWVNKPPSATQIAATVARGISLTAPSILDA
ncbi:hypothetical protein C8F04DRAFT_1248065 [Mycena alexandri]|uniref:Uncharacterized protein n=1 Tax=Mycena alexandri TaxID=1745969 RepID=A0AAD6TK26_9AGAR|nr:hypothetical protein C8F04DRAFT_1248065 [Mycena alexandri]